VNFTHLLADHYTRTAAAAFLLGCALAPRAEAFPDRPVKVIVPFAPGGGSDTFARLMIRRINDSDLSPEPWVVVNVPGGGGTIGSRRAKNALADGHTLLFLHDGIVTARYAGQATYGPDAFTAVAATGRIGAVICVAEDASYAKLEDLMAAAASSPGEVTFAANIGAPSYFMARLLEHAHGEARFRYVQSGGGARRFADLLGGHVEASAFSVSEYLNFREGGIRAIAYLGERRHDSLPDVPTAAEAGVDVTYANLQGWWAPKGTPGERVGTLANMLREVMETPSFRERLAELRIEPVFFDADEARRAFAERSRQIEALDLDRSPLRLPRLEVGFALLLLFGAGLALVGRRGVAGDAASGGDFEDDRPESIATWVRSAVVALLLMGYLATLHFLDGWFVLSSGVLIAALTVLGAGRRGLAVSVGCAVAIPLLFHLLLGGLLGVDLP